MVQVPPNCPFIKKLGENLCFQLSNDEFVICRIWLDQAITQDQKNLVFSLINWYCPDELDNWKKFLGG